MRAPVWSRLALAGLLTFSGLAGAGSLRVGPTLVVLDEEHPVAVVRVTNNNATTTAIDARALAWTQTDNQDVYAETQQLIVTPPVFDLEPGEVQTIRIGLNPLADAKAATIERSFRLFVQELPDQSTKSATTQMLMRVGVPVFVPPRDARADLSWKLVRADSGWRLEATNTGAAHARVTRMALRDDNGSIADEIKGGYILPGTTRTWSVPDGEKFTRLTAATLRIEHYDAPEQLVRLTTHSSAASNVALANSER